MIKVFLREKQLKFGKRGLYLDFYPPVVHPETRKQTRREHLRLYVFEKPKIETEKDHNKETRLLAENIRAQRQLELQKLSATPFKYEDLRRAALFSALTGLRFSDIQKLTWEEIRQSKSQGFQIKFRQKKTGYAETLPISEEAVELLGARGEPAAKVFPKLADWQCEYIAGWVTSAGISKKITFHNFRHTHATLQIMLGTDIYTVSKMLGHRNLKTTEIYAKIVDEKKREAANKISLK
jgi:integrase